jgi:hypothetical protein|tara:strand:+ start:4110 stop:4493 length:384 start_codon:yes stop_codon:yes gene_type:complete
MEEQLQEQVSYFLGQWGWMAMAAFALMVFRATLENVLESLKIFLGNDLNTDDVIHLNGRPARVVRVGVWKTIFFVYDIGCANGKPYVKGGCKKAVQNDKLKDYEIEKPLPMLDLSKWDDCEEKEKDK